MSTLTTFHLFPTLPIEIRLKIWSFNLSIPRTVTISCNREAIIRGAPRTAKSWATDTPSPPLLLVNRESRYEALTIYAPYFTTLSSPRPIYLSFFQDAVKFADGVLPYISRTPLLEIQKMVLQTKDCAYFGFYNMEILKSMKRLRELEIYAERDVAYWWNEGDRYLNLLMTDFEEAMEADPGWGCPMVRIFDGETGKEMRFIEGGAKIPGWEPPKE
jgi:2EXR family